MVLLLGGVNRNLLTILAQTLEADNTVGLGKQRVVAADARRWCRRGCGCRAGGPGCCRPERTDRQRAWRPRRLDSESRPFLVEPIPFLWAKNCRPIFSIMQYHPFYEMIAGEQEGFTPPSLQCFPDTRREAGPGTPSAPSEDSGRCSPPWEHRPPGRRKETAASCSRTFTAAHRPITSLTVASTRRTALVTAAQTMSSPSAA